jgi:transposase-like protein
MPAFPEGWDTPLNPFKKKEQGEDTMSRASNLGPKREDREEIMAKVRGLVAEGKAIAEAARILGVPVSTIYTWQYLERKQAQKAQKQAQEPVPVQVDSQEPERENQEPANQSVAQEKPEITVREQGFGPEDDEPIPYWPVDLRDLIAELRDDLDLERKKVANLEKKMDLLTSALSAVASVKATSPETRLARLLVAVFREMETGIGAKE